MKLLVVEDEPALNKIIAKRLKVENYAVDSALDGEEALEYLAVTEYDGAIVDIMMPRLDGYQTCALIKKNPRLKATPVIMLSSKDGLFDRARGRLAGSDEYLTKPFTKESLLRSVANYTHGRNKASTND